MESSKERIIVIQNEETMQNFAEKTDDREDKARIYENVSSRLGIQVQKDGRTRNVQVGKGQQRISILSGEKRRVIKKSI